MPRLLLVTSTTGYQAAAFREIAARLAVPLTLASDRCHQLEDPWRDGALAVRFEQPEESARAIVEFGATSPLAGIVALGDLPVVTAAHAAALLGLPFHPPEAAKAARSKFLSRHKYRAAGLPQPWFLRVSAKLRPEDSMRLLPSEHQQPFPCVLKPLVLSGSRGVIRADNEASFAAAFRRIQDLLQVPDIRKMRDPEAESILVEEFMAGAEVAVEAVVTGGELQVLAVFEKPDPLDGPFFEETIYLTPPRLSEEKQQAIVGELGRGVTALGLTHGPVHAELRLAPAGPVVLEIAARPIGGLCARALRFVHGERLISLEELILRHALGDDISQIVREPQIGSVGLTEAKAKESGRKIKVGKFPFIGNSKASIVGAHEGFIKVVADEQYGEILGVHIIGPQATELIAEAVTAMELEGTVEDLMNTIHAHPTLYEAMLDGFNSVYGLAINV